MGEAIGKAQGLASAQHEHRRNWSKAMSDNVALALVVYTGLQIFVTVEALKQGVSSTLPYFALILLVAAIIPASRWAERRWKDLSEEENCNETLKSRFRRDQLVLWVAAIGLPLVFTGLFKALFFTLS